MDCRFKLVNILLVFHQASCSYYNLKQLSDHFPAQEPGNISKGLLLRLLAVNPPPVRSEYYMSRSEYYTGSS